MFVLRIQLRINRIHTMKLMYYLILPYIPIRRGGRQERIFVALFDYDPPTMSPNPEACDEELPFREGQLIKVSYLYFYSIWNWNF